jgi:RNA polymerase sigma factor (sigma-70 family)
MILDILAKRHNEWIKLANNICKNPERSKDLVQDMYIKIYNRGKKIEEINECYIYFIMRNQFYNEIKKEKETILIDDFSDIEIEQEYYDKQKDEILSILEKERQKLSWYEKQIIDLTTEFGQRELSRQTGIHIQTIHNTTKKIKAKLWQSVEKKSKDLEM